MNIIRRFFPRISSLGQSITLMFIPERSKHVFKMVIPFYFLQFIFMTFVCLVAVCVIVFIDYVKVLGQVAANKALVRENRSLKNRLKILENKIDLVEEDLERIDRYAHKLRILTGQKGEKLNKYGLKEKESVLKRDVSNKKEREGILLKLNDIQAKSFRTMNLLFWLEDVFLQKSALARATPSIMPLDGRVSSYFGFRTDPYTGLRRKHLGIDIVAEPGSPVRAPADGVVVFAGPRVGYGKVIVIDHGFGIRTLYAHNSRLFVVRGMKVKRGDILSEVGSTGRSTGPHLHFEIRKHGKAVNPLDLVSYP